MALQELGGSKTPNPASPLVPLAAERKRIPMSVPVQKLEAPDIPGYHLHWFRGEPDRLQRALDGGYEFVDERELKVNAVGLGTTSTATGNTDMGSRVSVVSGDGVGRDGQPSRLVLMKIKQEWYEEDQQLVTNRNEQVASALRGGDVTALPAGAQGARGDASNRYVDKTRTVLPDLFTPGAMRKKTAGRI